jgi:hypothetical protein
MAKLYMNILFFSYNLFSSNITYKWIVAYSKKWLNTNLYVPQLI